jgi:hypothetical protein
MVNNRPFVPSQAVQRPNIAKRLEELAGLPHSIGPAKCSPMSKRIMQTRSTRIRFERSEGSDTLSTDIAQALGIKAAQ